jgi:hypothetical protein
MMLVAQIVSINIPKAQFDKLQDGAYHLDVVVNLEEARKSGDPKGFVQKEIARHLAGCVKHTELPLGFGCWRVSFTEKARQMFNFPGAFTA